MKFFHSKKGSVQEPQHNLERRIEVVGLRARIVYDGRFDVELYRFATSLFKKKKMDRVRT